MNIKISQITEDKYISPDFSIFQNIAWAKSKYPTWKYRIFEVEYSLEYDTAPKKIQFIGYIRQSKFYKILHLPHIFEAKQRITANIQEDIIAELLEYFKADINPSFVFFESDTDLDNFEEYNKSQENMLEKLNFHWFMQVIVRPYTNIICLRKTWEEIFANFNQNCRRRVRKAEKLGYQVFISEDKKYLDKAYEIMIEGAETLKHDHMSKSYYEKLAENFGGNIKYAVLESKDGNIEGVYILLLTRNTVWEINGGCNLHARKLDLNRYFKSRSIEEMQKLGFEYYEQWGGTDREHSRKVHNEKMFANLGIFKKEFGDNFVEYIGNYVYVYSQLHWFIYKTIFYINYYKLKLSGKSNTV